MLRKTWWHFVFVLSIAPALSAQTLQPVQTLQTTLSGLKAVDTVFIEANRFGFYPKQVKHQSTAHFLFVRNVTGLRNLVFTIKNASLAAVQQHALSVSGNPHWIQLMTLPPGAYTLTEASHPAWTCTITITN